METEEIIKTISRFGISKEKILEILSHLSKYQLIMSNNEQVENPLYSLTLTGGYYLNILSSKLVYVESVMFDTNIYELNYFKTLSSQTLAIEHEYSVVDKLILRKERLTTFLKYLATLENNVIGGQPKLKHLLIINDIRRKLLQECNNAIRKARRWHK